MAKVRVSQSYGPDVQYVEYMHKCSEVINVVIKQNQTVVGFADISRVPITICPHCLESLEYNDVQLIGNVNEFGWP